ncbi:MAG: site-2 protease family protein [Solirubrobacterales bacterium]
MSGDRSVAIEQLLELRDPAENGWRTRFKRSRAGRVLRILILPFVLLATRIELLIGFIGKLKYATALLSMFASVGAYTLFWGLPFAAGFVILLFVHEMGHVIQLRREGIKASAPFFIPFLGALIAMREMPKSAIAEARVGLAGPVLGSAGALAALAIGLLTGSELFKALAFTGFFLNLFNLLPVSPLDGGRAMAAISPWLWLVGMVVLAGLLILHFNAFLLLIVVIGGLESITRLRALRRERDEKKGYYDVSHSARALVALVYVGLAAALVVGMATAEVTHLGG